MVLLTTSSGQVVAQHGFTRALDVMSAAALGAAIMAEHGGAGPADGLRRLALAARTRDRRGGSSCRRSTCRRAAGSGWWCTTADSSLGLVRLFFDRLVEELQAVAPAEAPAREVLAADFENELNASLRSLFGR